MRDTKGYYDNVSFYWRKIWKSITIIFGSLNGKFAACASKTIALVTKLVYMFSVCSCWNLDFFRTVYTPFCLHPELTIIQAFAMDLIAVYPLALLGLVYLFMTMVAGQLYGYRSHSNAALLVLEDSGILKPHLLIPLPHFFFYLM